MSKLAAALLCLSPIGMAQAADKAILPEPGAIDIRVQAKGFGGASAADITVVLQSAAREVWQYCPNAQLPGIDVYHRSDHPQIDVRLTAKHRIAIGLAARDNHWAQYAFEFAHEYCHALINYSNNGGAVVAHAHYPNLWLEESLCEAASLFTLRALSRSWLIAPPDPLWREYAPWFSVYAEQRLAAPKRQHLAAKPFIIWFRANEAVLRRTGVDRDRNTIIAAQILTIFEGEPKGWGSLPFFRQASSRSLAQIFAAWRSRCPPDLHHFLAKLAGVFDVQI